MLSNDEPAATERLRLACRRKRVERPLHGAWLLRSAIARAELDHDSPSARKASSAACSSSTAAPARRPGARGAAPTQTLASSRSPRPRPKHRAKPPDSTRKRTRCDSSARFDPKARATSVSLGTSPATLRQRACEGEQHRTPGEGDRLACVTHDTTAGVDDECLRLE